MEKEKWWRKDIKTKIAFLLLIIPLAYLGLFLTFFLITTLLEQPCNRDGIYVIFGMISIVLMLFLPSLPIYCAVGSFVMQILALRNGESKFKNILMMFISVIYFVGGFILLGCIWGRIFEGMMSV